MREAVWHADGARQISEGCRLTRLDKRKKNLRCLVSRLNPAPSSAIAGSSRWQVARRHRRWFCDGFFLLLSKPSILLSEGGEPRIPGARTTLTPVMAIGRAQIYLVARPTLEARDAKQFIALAKSQPSKITIASAGTGTAPHLAAELFNQSIGTSITQVPYKGSAPALQDVMAGQTDVVFDPGIGFLHIRSGKVKLLAVASESRSPFFPDAPSYADLGIRNASLDVWFGVWSPNKVPADVSECFSAALKKVLASPVLKQRFAQLGAEPVPLDKSAFRNLLTDESRRLSTLIKERGIVVE